jgi:Outer membrane protein beta-barrel family/Carboxypeptidase regulatory-like domain
MKIFYILTATAILLVSVGAVAQKYTLKGAVADTAHKPLVSATVMLLNAKDSSLVNFSRTNTEGRFAFPNLSASNYILKVTFVGLQSNERRLTLNQFTDGDLGQITLVPIANQLDEVRIKAERAPIAMNGDTLEYNANAFKTQPNALVEDLLKKLPGVEVDRQGNVKAQGEKVKRVLVDGKEFFGRDPKIATQNLPADAVDKVQVFDRKSDIAQFSGIDDGQRDKTINLSLKENKKNGMFGTVAAGAGPDSRFSGRLNLNSFGKGKQLSILGRGNNLNQSTFSIDDYINFSGGLGRLMSGSGGRIDISSSDIGGMDLGNSVRPTGFTTSWSGGANLNREFNKKTELNGSYFFNALNVIKESDAERQTFLTNRSFTNFSQSFNQNQNQNHRINFTLDHKIDSLQTLKLTTNATFNHTDVYINGSSSAVNDRGQTENEGTRLNQANGSGWSLNSDLLYRKKLLKKGRFFTTNLSFGLNTNDQNGVVMANNSFFVVGKKVRTDSIRQNQTQRSNRYNYGLGLTYTEPLGRRWYAELNYNVRQNLSDATQEVYDLNRRDVANKPQLNGALSNVFESIITYQRGGAGLRMVRQKSNLSFGINTQQTDLEANNISQKTLISRSFNYLLPTAVWSYQFSQSNRAGLRYTTTAQEPSAQQLQPIVNNNDPLNKSVGNPELKPEYSHRVNLDYSAFNQLAFTNFFISANVAYTRNKITYSQTINDSLVRTMKPINVATDYSANGYASYGFRIKPLSLRINLTANFMYQWGINFANNVENQTRSVIPSGEIRLDFNPNDVIDWSFGGKITQNQTSYSVSKNFNQILTNQDLFGEMNFKLPKDFRLGTTFNYYLYSGLRNAPDQQIPIWDASVSKSFLKNNRGELKLSASDLLNRNLGITRTAALNFIENQRVRSLGRYFLLTFTYSIKGGPAASSGAIFRAR